MIISELEGRFFVARSGIRAAGRGLFAKRSLSKGDQFEVVGPLIRAGSTADETSRYADAYKFRVGSFLLIPLGFGGMVNHSAKPNMKKVVKGRRLFLRALRDIEEGEELLFSYSRYAQRRFKLKNQS